MYEHSLYLRTLYIWYYANQIWQPRPVNSESRQSEMEIWRMEINLPLSYLFLVFISLNLSVLLVVWRPCLFGGVYSSTCFVIATGQSPWPHTEWPRDLLKPIQWLLVHTAHTSANLKHYNQIKTPHLFICLALLHTT